MKYRKVLQNLCQMKAIWYIQLLIFLLFFLIVFWSLNILSHNCISSVAFNIHLHLGCKYEENINKWNTRGSKKNLVNKESLNLKKSLLLPKSNLKICLHMNLQKMNLDVIFLANYWFFSCSVAYYMWVYLPLSLCGTDFCG